MYVRSSLSLSFHSKPPPPPPLLLPCSHHHWTTVEVVSGREMMPNLTGVNPYLYSLHSRFCFKGFVYTRPINHLLPSHNPIAFKVGARLPDNVQFRCQCKSHSSPLKEGIEDSQNSRLITLPSQIIGFSSSCGRSHDFNISCPRGWIAI